MDIFNFFKKPAPPVLFRCTKCEYELEFEQKELRQMARQSDPSAPCPFSTPCHICHIGFMIPVRYKNGDGKEYSYKHIKPLIKNLDTKTVMERIFSHEDSIPLQKSNRKGKH